MCTVPRSSSYSGSDLQNKCYVDLITNQKKLICAIDMMQRREFSGLLQKLTLVRYTYALPSKRFICVLVKRGP